MLFSRKEFDPSVAFVIHGRNLTADAWHQLMLGDVQQQLLGTLPKATHAALNVQGGPKNVVGFVIGSWGSQAEDGRYEAEVIRDLALEHLDYFEAYDKIATHKNWKKGRETVRRLFESAVIMKGTLNTHEEMIWAGTYLGRSNVDSVRQITNLGHAARCQTEREWANTAGIIPRQQDWQVKADDIPYGGLKAKPAADDPEVAVVAEVDHRKDDETRLWPVEMRPRKFMRDYFRHLPRERRRLAAYSMRQALDETSKMSEGEFRRRDAELILPEQLAA